MYCHNSNIFSRTSRSQRNQQKPRLRSSLTALIAATAVFISVPSAQALELNLPLLPISITGLITGTPTITIGGDNSLLPEIDISVGGGGGLLPGIDISVGGGNQTPSTGNPSTPGNTTNPQLLPLLQASVSILPAGTSLPSAGVGEQYNQVLNVSVSGASCIYKLVDGILPPGLSLSVDGRLLGIPSLLGNFSFTVAAIDTSLGININQVLSINVGAISLAPAIFPQGSVGVLYPTQTLAVSGGQSPYNFAINSGALPPGLALNGTNGTISGTPQTAGVYDFSVKVSDAKNQEGLGIYRIIIDSSTSAIGFQTTTLATGVVGTPYPAQTVKVSGGVAPYSFAVSSGSLPPGLTLNASSGVISGTPTAEGNYPFILTVSDSKTPQANRRSQSFVLVISGQAGTGKPGTGSPGSGNSDSSNSGQSKTHVVVEYIGGKTILSAVFAPDVAIQGREGEVFLFAWLPETISMAPNSLWIMDSSRNWHLSAGCSVMPTIFSGALRTLDNISIIPDAMDLSVLSGTELYIGYGMSPTHASGQACNDMMARKNWVKIYTAP